MFGEVYPDPVRVVCIGRAIDDLLANPKDQGNREYSVEFCGGTHLSNTAEAKAFALISEEGGLFVYRLSGCNICSLPNSCPLFLSRTSIVSLSPALLALRHRQGYPPHCRLHR